MGTRTLFRTRLTYDNKGIHSRDGDWDKAWADLVARWQRLKQAIHPGYVPLTEEESIRQGCPVQTDDPIGDALRWVDIYDWRDERQLSDKALVIAAELAGVSSEVWSEIREWVDMILDDSEIEDLRASVRSSKNTYEILAHLTFSGEDNE